MGQRERTGTVSYARPEDVLACVDTPVLEAIADHRRAAEAMHHAEAALRLHGGSSGRDIEGYDEMRLEHLADAEWSACDRLTRQVPETLAGLLSVLSYVRDALDADPQLFEDGDRVVALVRNLGAAAKAILAESQAGD